MTPKDASTETPVTTEPVVIKSITLNFPGGDKFVAPIRQRVSIPLHKDFSAKVRKFNRDNAEFTKRTKVVLEMQAIKDSADQTRYYVDHIDQIIDTMDVNEEREELEFRFTMEAFPLIIDTRELTPEQLKEYDLPRALSPAESAAIKSKNTTDDDGKLVLSEFWANQEDYTAIKDAVAWFRRERMGLG